MLTFAEHEALDHPVAMLLALPADQGGDLVGAFRAQHAAATAAIPALATGLAEKQLAMHYVLLHDAASMGPAALEGVHNKLHYLASALGGNVQLLTINSAAAAASSNAGGPAVSQAGNAQSGGDPQRWATMLGACIQGGGAGEPAARPPPPTGGLGCALLREDLKGLASFVHEMAVRSLIPHMEGRVRALSAQVASTRRGLRNQLRSFLWRKSSSSFGAAAVSAVGSLLEAGAPPSPQQQAQAQQQHNSGGGSSAAAAPAAPQYPASSVEAQMRQLADLALMLGDYDTATSTLRLLASDFKGDKAYKHYAGVQVTGGAVKMREPFFGRKELATVAWMLATSPRLLTSESDLTGGSGCSSDAFGRAACRRCRALQGGAAPLPPAGATGPTDEG